MNLFSDKKFISQLLVFVCFWAILLVVGIILNQKTQTSEIVSGEKIECDFGQYLKQCKRGPCCCPVGALCD
jgi:hypothetical protein